jgi:hypothetical protein
VRASSSEAEDLPLSSPLDLHLGLPDAHDGDAIEGVALTHQMIADEGDGPPVSLRDGLEDQGRG